MDGKGVLGTAHLCGVNCVTVSVGVIRFLQAAEHVWKFTLVKGGGKSVYAQAGCRAGQIPSPVRGTPGAETCVEGIWV